MSGIRYIHPARCIPRLHLHHATRCSLHYTRLHYTRLAAATCWGRHGVSAYRFLLYIQKIACTYRGARAPGTLSRDGGGIPCSRAHPISGMAKAHMQSAEDTPRYASGVCYRICARSLCFAKGCFYYLSLYTLLHLSTVDIRHRGGIGRVRDSARQDPLYI